MSLKNARRWAAVYLTLEILWIIFWIGTMLAYQIGLGEEGEFYRLVNELSAFHLVLLPTVAYTMRDSEWHIVLAYIAVIATDLTLVLKMSLHTPQVARDVTWGFGTAMAVCAFGLFISVMMLFWFIFVWSSGIKFRRPGTTKELEPLNGDDMAQKIRLRLK